MERYDKSTKQLRAVFLVHFVVFVWHLMVFLWHLVGGLWAGGGLRDRLGIVFFYCALVVFLRHLVVHLRPFCCTLLHILSF